MNSNVHSKLIICKIFVNFDDWLILLIFEWSFINKFYSLCLLRIIPVYQSLGAWTFFILSKVSFYLIFQNNPLCLKVELQTVRLMWKKYVLKQHIFSITRPSIIISQLSADFLVDYIIISRFSYYNQIHFRSLFYAIFTWKFWLSIATK